MELSRAEETTEGCRRRSYREVGQVDPAAVNAVTPAFRMTLRYLNDSSSTSDNAPSLAAR